MTRTSTIRFAGTYLPPFWVVDSYDFAPTANDPDGDPLSFSIAGLPGWAAFDTATGRLSGNPTAGDAGIYAGIRISVSDGRDTSSLPAFAITVLPPPNAVPTIFGTPPASVVCATGGRSLGGFNARNGSTRHGLDRQSIRCH